MRKGEQRKPRKRNQRAQTGGVLIRVALLLLVYGTHNTVDVVTKSYWKN